MTFTTGGRCWNLDCILDRLWAWWNRHVTGGGRHGRRAFDRDLDHLEQTVSTRPWPVPTPPAPDPDPDGSWELEAIMRSRTPHLYAPDREYWRDAWADMALFMAAWRADSAQLRAECGLAA